MRLATIAALCLCASAATAQQPATLEQRLASIVGSLIVENNRIAIELEAAKAEIARLKAELQQAKEKRDGP